MCSKRRVDFVVKNIINTIFDGAVVRYSGHFCVGRFNCQLATHSVGGVINERIFQKGNASTLKPSFEAFKFMLNIALLEIPLAAVGDTGFRSRRSRVVDKHPYTKRILLF